MKTCSKCGESKPLEAYSIRRRNDGRKDSVRSHCKVCSRAISKAYVLANPDKVAEYRESTRDHKNAQNREYYSINKERIIANTSAWKVNNPEKHRYHRRNWKVNNPKQAAEISLKYRRNNAEKIKEAKRKYRAENPESIRAQGHVYRTRKASNGVNLVTAAETAAIAAMPCTACGAAGPSEIDHIVPLARGGSHTIGNLMPLCKSCNSSKHDMLYIEWKYSARPQALKAFASP